MSDDDGDAVSNGDDTNQFFVNLWKLISLCFNKTKLTENIYLDLRWRQLQEFPSAVNSIWDGACNLFQ